MRPARTEPPGRHHALRRRGDGARRRSSPGTGFRGPFARSPRPTSRPTTRRRAQGPLARGIAFGNERPGGARSVSEGDAGRGRGGVRPRSRFGLRRPRPRPLTVIGMECLAVSDFDPTRPLESARTIPNTWYTSPEVDAAERRRRLRRAPGRWSAGPSRSRAGRVPHGRRRRRADPGRPRRRRRAAGVLQRLPAPGRAGPDRAVRHAPRKLRCRYHGWTYDLAGRLRGTPEFDGVADFRREDNGLVAGRRVAEWGPFVWVHLRPAGAAVGELPALRSPTWAAGSVRRADVRRPARATTWRATGRCTSITTSTAATT